MRLKDSKLNTSTLFSHKKMPSHLKGLILTVSGILVLSPDSLLVRLIATDVWTLLFWRGLLMAAGVGIGLALIYRGELPRACRRIGRRGWLAGALMGAGTLLFVQALSRTSVANVLIVLVGVHHGKEEVDEPIFGRFGLFG